MSTNTKPYKIELRSAWTNKKIDEISKLCSNRRFVMGRNIAEEFSCDIDLVAFEERMRAIGENPVTVLQNYATDIVVYKNDTPLFRVHLWDQQISLQRDNKIVRVKADGYLNLFKDRYTGFDYYQPQSMTSIAWKLIDNSQDLPNGDFGITLGPNQFTTPDRERTYSRKNIREALIEQTEIEGSKFDFQFTWDKKFNTYEKLGDERPDVILEYPRNIVSLETPKTAVNLYNEVTALGSGLGVEQLASTADDNDSQVGFKLRQKITIYNSVEQQNELDEHAEKDVAKYKAEYLLPGVTVSGAKFNVLDLMPGNRIRLIINGVALLPIDGMFRVEKITVTLDANDVETIAIVFDDYGL